MIYSDFYILRSLDRPVAPKLVAEWVVKDKRLGAKMHDIDMNLWLISQAYKDARLSDTPEAKKFKAGMAKWKGMEATTEIAVWDAIWNPRNPLVLARKVDTSDIRRIKVPSIPRHRPPGTYKNKQMFVREFVAAAKKISD